jgi:hypothetical protein
LSGSELDALLKTGLRYTKCTKIPKIPVKIKRLPKHVKNYRKASILRKKARNVACFVKDSRTIVGATATTCRLLESIGIAPGISTGWIPLFKTVSPFLKPSSLYLAGSSLQKAYPLSTKLRTICSDLDTTSSPEEKVFILKEALTELEQLNPGYIQKKLGLKEPLKQNIEALQETLTVQNQNSIDASEDLLHSLYSKSKLLVGFKMLRTTAKVGRIAGSFLVFSGVSPFYGHAIMYSSFLASFLNWAGQRYYFKK